MSNLVTELILFGVASSNFLVWLSESLSSVQLLAILGSLLCVYVLQVLGEDCWKYLVPATKFSLFKLALASGPMFEHSCNIEEKIHQSTLDRINQIGSL